MNEIIVRYKNLYNALVLFASNYDYLMSLDSPTFDVEFELGSEFDIGLSDENVEHLFYKRRISQELKDLILEFKELIIAVPDSFWTIEELESNPVWNQVRDQANEILEKLGETDRSYDFSITKIVE